MTEAKVLLPIDPDWPEARQLALIEISLRQGMPWAAVATALGVPDKRAAKRMRRDLEHRVRLRQMTA